MKKFSLSKYFIVGPENVSGKENGNIQKVVHEVLQAGFTFLQIRSKVASARELIECVRLASEEILKIKSSASLVINDRLDVALACRMQGIKLDGIHIGQEDVPANVCRKFLGEDAIVGLSAPTQNLLDYVEKNQQDYLRDVDYLGAGPLHETLTKSDCKRDENGKIILQSALELKRLKEISPLPVVVGGGVKLNDIELLKQLGVDGFFVISAITDSQNYFETAKNFVQAWDA